MSYRRSSITFVCWVLAGACSGSPPQAMPGVPGQVLSLADRASAELGTIHQGGDFPGATMSLCFGDGRRVDLAVGTHADSEAALDPEARMLLGSVGKTFVSALMVQLFEEGRLHEDDRACDWFEEDAWYGEVANGDRLTLGQLLQHRTGLERHEFKPAFWNSVIADPDRHWEPHELLAFVLGDDPLFAPGQGWAYSDSNYILLGMILERLTAQPFYELVQTRFLDPLALGDTLPSDRRELPRIAAGAVIVGRGMGVAPSTLADGRFTYNVQFEWCGGGFVSTASDLASWALALYGGDVLGEGGLARLLTCVPATELGPTCEYGLGVMVRQTRLGPFQGHDGFMPGYITCMGYFPQHDVAAAIQVNCDDERALKMPMHEVLVRVVEAAQASPTTSH